MKFGVFSDVHGNLEALLSVLKCLKAERVDRRVCLGDLVGYGPDPGACVDLVREHADMVLAGNHDHAALGLTDLSHFNPYARFALLWTQSQLTAEVVSFLSGLHVANSWEGLCFAHSSPCEPLMWHYMISSEDAQANFRCFAEPICFVGHSHSPVFFVEESPVRVVCVQTTRFAIEKGKRYLINVGSVGQPRDGDPRAAYLIYDVSAGTVELKRVPYDIAVTQEKMARAGLPRFLIERLAIGY